MWSLSLQVESIFPQRWHNWHFNKDPPYIGNKNSTKPTRFRWLLTFGLLNRCTAILASLFIPFQIGSCPMLCWLADDSKATTHMLTSNQTNGFCFLSENVSRQLQSQLKSWLEEVWDPWNGLFQMVVEPRSSNESCWNFVRLNIFGPWLSIPSFPKIDECFIWFMFKHFPILFHF